MKESQGKAGKRRVTFKVLAPSANEIFVVGDFNDWNTQAHPLAKDDRGFWKVTLQLAPGEYEYKLLVDGQWWEDAQEGKSVQNRFGTLNRLLVVPQK